MLIACPNCATSYDLEVASLRPSGRRVRCVRCRTVWHAELSHADRLIAAAEELAPVRRAVEAVAEAVAAGPGEELPADHINVPASLEGDSAAGSLASDAPLDSPALGMAEGSEEAGAASDINDTAEIDSPPIAPVDLDAGQPIADIEAGEETGAQAAEDPLEDIESVAARRFARPVPAERLALAVVAPSIGDADADYCRCDHCRLAHGFCARLAADCIVLFLDRDAGEFARA